MSYWFEKERQAMRLKKESFGRGNVGGDGLNNKIDHWTTECAADGGTGLHLVEEEGTRPEGPGGRKKS